MFDPEYTRGSPSVAAATAEATSGYFLSALTSSLSALPVTAINGMATMSRPTTFGSKRTSPPRPT